jgi:hypothetical protein
MRTMNRNFHADKGGRANEKGYANVEIYERGWHV